MKKHIGNQRGLVIELICLFVYSVIVISLFKMSGKMAVSEATKIQFKNVTADAYE